MLGDCVGERLSLGGLLLVMNLANWSKCPVAAARYSCGVFTEKWQLRSIGRPKVFILSGGLHLFGL